MGSQHQVRIPSRHFPRGTDQDGIANDSRKAINLSAQLDLDRLAFLQCCRSLFGIGFQGRVRGDVRAWGDGGAVANALGNLLSLVDLGDLLFKKLVAALAELDNVGVLGTPSYARSANEVGGTKEHGDS